MDGERPRFWIAFGCLLAALALAMFMSVFLTIRAHAEPAPAPPIIHVTDDPGGSVMVYYERYKALNAARAEIHFHGGCFSSCTIILFVEFTNIRACADEGAIFGFHKPFAMKPDGKVMRSKAAIRAARKIWAAWLKELPDPLRKYLTRVRVPSAAEGDEQNTMLVLPASLLLPKCQVAEASL